MPIAEKNPPGQPKSQLFHRWLAVILGAILLAPSLWMLAEIPPLWRDLDAYHQVTGSAAKATYLGHGLLYCFAARVPLYLGSKFEAAVSARPSVAGAAGSLLTDSGVFFLIFLQHIAFAGAAFYLIVTAVRTPWARIALALAFSGAAVFYTVAHSVGSEALSLICVLLVAASGLRLIRSARRKRRDEWLLFSVLLGLSVLTRYANFWLVLVIPLSFLITWIQRRLQLLTSARTCRRRRRSADVNLRQAAIAMAIGISVLVAANLITRIVCRSARLDYHSRIGHTFLWRVPFLKDLPQQERDELLDRVAGRTRSVEAQKLVYLLGQTFRSEGEFAPGAYLAKAHDLLLKPETRHQTDKLDFALNEMTFAFLFPPSPELLRAGLHDFSRARQVTFGGVTQFLFATTAYYFDHAETMPACASLQTFRDTDARRISAIPSQHLYFQSGRNLIYNVCFLGWVAAVSILMFLKRGQAAGVAVVSYSISLNCVGLLTMISSCLVGEFLPRYALPMLQLWAASWFIVIGALADHRTQA